MRNAVKYKDVWLMRNSLSYDLYHLMLDATGDEKQKATKKFNEHFKKVTEDGYARGEFRRPGSKGPTLAS